MKKSLKIAIIVILCPFILSSCSKKDQPSPQNPEKIENSAVAGINPLTGLPEDLADINARPIAIMINNIHIAQPTLGISKADIIYECLVEGGITRLMAVYKDPTNVPLIGSIRSARPYYVNLARGLDAVYMHAGGSTDADNMLNSGVIDHFNLGNYNDMMWRDETRKSNMGTEHSAVTSGKKLQDGIKKSKIRITVEKAKNAIQTFSEDSPVLKGKDAKKLTATFSSYKNTIFEYDSAKKTYLISQFNKAQMDGSANVQNSKENVVILKVKTRDIDSYGLKDLDLTSGGTGQYMSRGKIMPIKWKKASDDAPLKYTTEDGQELLMLPGQIYICAVPTDAQVDVS